MKIAIMQFSSITKKVYLDPLIFESCLIYSVFCYDL